MILTILGFEGQAGIGAKSGKAYDMGRVFTVAQLAPAMAGGVAAGSMGNAIECENSGVVRALVNQPLPFDADCDVRTVMRFGKPEQMCFSVKPTKK